MIPWTSALSPAMLAMIDVIGATVVTTCNLAPPIGPLRAAPADVARAGQRKAATFEFLAEDSPAVLAALLPQAANVKQIVPTQAIIRTDSSLRILHLSDTTLLPPLSLLQPTGDNQTTIIRSVATRRITIPQENIPEIIRGAGGRMTGPTRLVLEILFDGERHFSADDLFEELDRRSPGISQSTVYRVLQRLGQLQIIEHVHSGVGSTFYHLRQHNHAHLVCTDCGSITDVPDTIFEQLTQTAQTDYSFTVQTHHAAILGRCANCATSS